MTCACGHSLAVDVLQRLYNRRTFVHRRRRQAKVESVNPVVSAGAPTAPLIQHRVDGGVEPRAKACPLAFTQFEFEHAFLCTLAIAFQQAGNPHPAAAG